MHRNQLLTLLNHYVPHDQQELQFKQEMISFIQQYKNCFERSLDIGHITASAWLLNNDKTKALLMHHAKLNKWFQLGGHCDGNPDVLGVALKEAQEESGINTIVPLSETIFDIDIHLIPANSREKEHYHYDVRFLLQITSNEHVVQNSESKELKWISNNRGELPNDNPSVMRMFNKWIQTHV